MTLSSLLEVMEIRKLFNGQFHRENFSMNGNMQAPPLTSNYSLVGTAFDYLLRFMIERKNPHVISSRWIAEKALISITNGSHEFSNEIKIISQNNLERAKRNHAKYLKNGILNNDLLKSCISLAHIDFFYRLGINYDMTQVYSGDMVDLRQLAEIVERNWNLFESNEMCYLNPDFGDWSEFVGGADADLIIGDTIIDIKTTIKPALTRSHVNRMMAYYTFSKYGKIFGRHNVNVENIAVYFSRHGILHSIPVSKITGGNLDYFVNEFVRLARFHRRCE